MTESIERVGQKDRLPLFQKTKGQVKVVTLESVKKNYFFFIQYQKSLYLQKLFYGIK